MNIYLDNGYLDMKAIIETNIPFIFIVGARGTGKTYGSLKVMKEDNYKFIYMRRTQTQADMINKPDFSPFKSLNTDNKWTIGTKPISKYNAGFYNQEQNEEGTKIEIGEPIGYTCALSTISNLRGFDASDVEKMLYDEFIPEKHERPLKKEAMALFNAYESINRNRELKGKKPLQLVCMANANDLGNPVFLELGLVKKAIEMRNKKQEVSINKERGIMLIILNDSPISARKANTALYRLTKGSDFESMAIKNNFSGEEIGRVKSKPLKEYKPIVSIGEITVYTHKSSRELYVTTHKTGSPVTFGTGEAERARFRRAYSWIWDEYMENNIEFEEYLCEILLTKIYS